VKVVGVFGCHTIEWKDHTQAYLRADYGQKCYDAEWIAMAFYATLWLIFYVAGLPAFVLFTLLRYSKEIYRREMAQSTGKGEGLESLDTWLSQQRLAHLLDDYKTLMPCLLWGKKTPLSNIGLR
jgi:hypothetical protein